jgi:murein DD-endopeptidase MepM/ murein hydrolase activator NlpD
MKLRYYNILFLSLLSISFIKYDNNPIKFPKDFFQSPISFPIHLAGTFGELRNNHFHTGIDIKASSNRIGDLVFTIGDGYISKVTILSYGYGKHIEVTHPNGYTSVYAHMDHFTSSIDSAIKKAQYKLEMFEVELKFHPTQYPVKRGEQIGTIGMTGSTAGPHLHLEIRVTDTYEACNPLLMGLSTIDQDAPFFTSLKIYKVKDDEYLDLKTIVLDHKNRAIELKDTIAIMADTVSFGVSTFDNSAFSGRNGTYKVEASVENNKFFGFEMNKIPMEYNKYIYAHIDYVHHLKTSTFFNNLFKHIGNRLEIYDDIPNNYIVLDTVAKKITLKAKDVNGNQSSLIYYVKKAKNTIVDELVIEESPFDYYLPCSEESVITNSEAKLYFPQNALYKPLKLNYQIVKDSSYGAYSNVHIIHNRNTAIHSFITLRILSKNLPDSLKKKAFVGICNESNVYMSYGGKWIGNEIEANINQFGKYAILLDTIKPNIIPTTGNTDFSKASKISFEITDNIKAAKKEGNLYYKGMIDGKWILMEYDEKSKHLFYKIDGSIPKGNHHFLLLVSDKRFNIAKHERNIIL